LRKGLSGGVARAFLMMETNFTLLSEENKVSKENQAENTDEDSTLPVGS